VCAFAGVLGISVEKIRSFVCFGEYDLGWRVGRRPGLKHSKGGFLTTQLTDYLN